jgi:signal recognition particle subunit SRP54
MYKAGIKKNIKRNIRLCEWLQGVGKTTAAGKLAKYLSETAGEKVLLVSTDVYRPAAIEQLEKLAGQVGADFKRLPDGMPPADMAAAAKKEAVAGGYDVLLVDTAGRLQVSFEPWRGL